MDDMKDWLVGFYEMNPDAVEVVEEKIKKKPSTLTLAMELPAMDYCDKDFYKNLSEEHKKEIGLWLLMRYMSSAQNNPEHHLIMVNDLVNHNFNSLSKHPELQWKLLTLCGTNREEFHPWIPPGKGIQKNKVEQALLGIYPLMKDEDIELLLKINTTEEIKEFLKDNGFDDKELKEIFKADPKGT